MGFSPEVALTVQKLISTVAGKIHIGGKKQGSLSAGESCRAVWEAELPRGWAGWVLAGWVTPAAGGAPLAAPGRAGWVLVITAPTAR